MKIWTYLDYRVFGFLSSNLLYLNEQLSSFYSCIEYIRLLTSRYALVMPVGFENILVQNIFVKNF